MTETLNVGYIGLGNIGKPSARHLIGDRYRAHVYDVVTEAVEELAVEGAVGCASVAELAGVCMHIGVCVRDEPQVEVRGAKYFVHHGWTRSRLEPRLQAADFEILHTYGTVADVPYDEEESPDLVVLAVKQR